MSGHRLGLGRSSRLHGRSQFRAVFAGRLRKSIGPLTVCVRANDLAFNRFGLSVPRAVGTAVQRNRVKRLLREALRLNQYEWAGGYDMVVLVRPHEPASLSDYGRRLSAAIVSVQQRYSQSQTNKGRDQGPVKA